MDLPCDNWSAHDTVAQSIYYVAHAADWGTTLDIAPRRGEGYYETNPVLGTHPSRARVNTHFAVTGLLHMAISCVLSPKYRTVWQYTTIAVEVGYASNNLKIGLNLNF